MKANIYRIAALSLVLAFCTAALCPAKDAKKYDVDFTKYNFNMASAQIFDMTIDAENYIGKTVRIKGKYYYSESDMGKIYSVLFYDATACCQTGLSFIPSDVSKLPKHLEDIEVCGVYRYKQLKGRDFYYIEQSN